MIDPAPDIMAVPSIAELHELKRTLYTREYLSIEKTKFPSTTDRLKAYEYAKEAQDKVNDLLELEEKSTPLPTPKQNSAAEEVWKYVRAGIWSAINSIRNMKLRAEYISKISSNSADYLGRISNGALSADELEALTKEAIAARNMVLEATRAKLGKTSTFFSEMLKRDGLTYDQLVDRYSERRYQKSFSSLTEDTERVTVLGDIIEASGRSNSLVNAISKIQGGVGIATAIILVGVIVWDVVTSSDPGVTAARDTWVALGAAGVGIAAEAIASAAINAGLVAAGVTDAIAAGVAFVGGIVASILLVAFIAPLLGSLFDLIVNAFSLRIPPELMSSIITVIKVPLDSALHVALTVPLK